MDIGRSVPNNPNLHMEKNSVIDLKKNEHHNVWQFKMIIVDIFCKWKFKEKLYSKCVNYVFIDRYFKILQISVLFNSLVVLQMC